MGNKKSIVKKKTVLLALAALLAAGALWLAWARLAAPTRIAFVNYQAISLGQISRANDSRFIKIKDLPAEELDKAGDYDLVLVNGMGLRIDAEQREHLVKAAENGTPVLTTAATNPQNLIVSVDSTDVEYLKQYLNGGRNNYRNMLRYVRKFIDGKSLFAPKPGDPVPGSGASLLYYPDGGDDMAFGSVAEYEAWLRKAGKWSDTAPHVILTGQMGVADSLVAELERAGNVVYPVSVIQRFIAGGHADSIGAAAMINMAHGRMGDMVTAYLQRTNIPLLAPLNVNRDYDEWMNDKTGMNGGFLSQSVVTPEIDGAIRPFALFAHYKGKDGLPYVEAIPGRLQEFVQTVGNYIGLQRKANKDKKVAIFYFKGPGQSSLTAEGMEVAPSLFNLLTRLKAEGYDTGTLPADAAALEQMIAERGRIFNGYATGAREDFVRTARPELISKDEYERWTAASTGERLRAQADSVDGPFPGHAMSDGEGRLALSRLQFGNIVLIPQPAAGLGDDDFKIVHGTDAAPPHEYIAAYMWARHGFGADAIMHFGAHGSLEFTPRKQVALSSEDWPDRLVGAVPHFYVWATSNVGEAMTAKRRSYAQIINYLTPPFIESGVRGVYKNLTDALMAYNKAATHADSLRTGALVKRYAVELGLHRELRLDSVLSHPYAAEDIARIENFADELANERITGAHYVLGVPYTDEHITSTVLAMTVDPLAYSLARLKGTDAKACRAQAERTVRSLLESGTAADDARICAEAGITQELLDSARNITKAIEGSKDMMSRMMVMGAMMPREQETALKVADRKAPKKKHGMMPGMSPERAIEMARKMGADEEAIKKMKAAMARKNVTPGMTKGAKGGPHGHKAKELTKAEIELATAVGEVERSLRRVDEYRRALLSSPQAELASIVNALAGGFTAPTSGGDPVLNPEILPTGRNMYAVNAEETPSAVAWEKGKELAENTLELYRSQHDGALPRKVSYTLWSSEFIETEGATVAQVLYMLGVEPVRDPFGRVTDLRLIPEEELGRPRIDVVVQTSGQLRDLAASRLFLISRAVRMAAEAKDKKQPNYVAEGVVESERYMVERGVSPKEARELSRKRVFGGANGSYGTGIQAMVEAGDRWDKDSEIAETYIANMGADYGSEETWEQYSREAFEAALTRTDVVVQPRQSNTWGALSLDHVYEFMGGLNLAVRNVTGEDPEAYLSDYRNRNRARMQDVKEAIGVESRTTVLNPNYVKEKLKGGAGDVASIADMVKNTYGWNVMKPEAIDDELWDGIYDTYVADVNNLGIKERMAGANPAAVQEMTAVMLETVRKGMWDASAEQVDALARLHTETVEKYGAACTGFVCDNAALRKFITEHSDPQTARSYNAAVAQVRAESVDPETGMVMKREEMNVQETTTTRVSGAIVAAAVVVALLVIVAVMRRRRARLNGGSEDADRTDAEK